MTGVFIRSLPGKSFIGLVVVLANMVIAALRQCEESGLPQHFPKT
jgi:hypothetical protein